MLQLEPVLPCRYPVASNQVAVNWLLFSRVPFTMPVITSLISRNIRLDPASKSLLFPSSMIRIRLVIQNDSIPERHGIFPPQLLFFLKIKLTGSNNAFLP